MVHFVRFVQVNFPLITGTYMYVHVHNAASFVNTLYNYTNCFVSKVHPEGTHGHMYTSSHNQYLYTLDSNVT